MITDTVGAIVRAKQNQELLTLAASATVAEAVSMMSRAGAGSVLIRGAGGAIDGIFTERDVMHRVVGERRDAQTTPLSAVMSPNVRRVDGSATLEEALRLMVVHGHRHLLVDDGGRVLGLVSIRDLMTWLVMPEDPVAAEGRVGVIRARTQDAIRSLKGSP